MLESAPPNHLYTCDVCGRVASGESADMPPKGMTTLLVRPPYAVGASWHACIGPCLVSLANRTNLRHDTGGARH